MALDLDALTNGPVMDIFGAPAQFIPRAGAPFPIPGIFKESFLVEDPNGMPGIATSALTLSVRAAEFTSPPLQKDQVRVAATATHAGGIFVIKEVQPDSEGWIVLALNYVGP
jgi:hypothetical protein